MLQSYAQSPNVVVVFADDVGVGDISSYRRKNSNNIIVETPEIDQLMSEGIHFTDAHSPTALCAPSRYSVITGNNTYRSYAPRGVWGSYERSPIEDNDLTLGSVMKRAGYNTAFFGKWHLGGDYYRKNQRPTIYRSPRVAPELDVDITEMVKGPNQVGFDYSFTYPAGVQDVPYIVYENQQWYPLKPNSTIDVITQAKMDLINVTLDKDEGLGDSEWNPFDMGPLLVNKAVDYIRSNASASSPFFMYYSTQAVHLPHTPADFIDGKPIQGTTPNSHLDMVAEFDAQIGLIVKTLKEEGVYNNTLIIITSDNGGLSWASAQTGHNSSDIYRGSKNSIHEGGHRVPFIAVWPGKIGANVVSDDLASAKDILATISAAANETIANNEAKDSFNLLPIMLGESNAKKRKFLMQQGGTGNNVAYREEDWKLIMKMNNQDQPSATELYNLKNDVSENNNLINSSAQQGRVADMLSVYKQIRNSGTPTKTLHDTTTDPNPVNPTVDCNSLPSTIMSSNSINISVDYTADQNRDVVIELWDTSWLGQGRVTVAAGAGTATVTLNLNNAPAAGSNYLLKSSIRPIGAAWQQNFDACNKTNITFENGNGGTSGFYIINRQTGKKLRPQNINDAAELIQVDVSTTDDYVLWEQVDSQGGFFYLKNVATGKYFRPTTDTNGSKLEQRPTTWNGNYTQWEKVTSSNGYFYLKNRQTAHYFRPNTDANNSTMVQRPVTYSGNYTQWIFQNVAQSKLLSNELEMTVYHEQTDDLLQLDIVSQKNQNAELLIIDISGKNVYSSQLQLDKGKQVLSMKTNKLNMTTNGIYILKLKTDTTSKVVRISK